jgi:hypothetical protein
VRHDHPWQAKLNTEGLDLGSGKRMLIRGGVLDKRFQISIPREMADGSQANFF